MIWLLWISSTVLILGLMEGAQLPPEQEEGR